MARRGYGLDIRSNLELRWRLIDVSGDALDSSGNGYDGTIDGATQTVDGAELDGLNDIIDNTDAGLTAALEGLTEITVCFFAKSSAFALNDTLVSFGLSAADDCYAYQPFNTTGGNGFSIWCDGEFIATSLGSAPADDTYSHFAHVQSGESLHEFFINGVSVGTDTTSKTTAASVTGLNVGNYIGNGEFFAGTIKDVRVYPNRALTADQLKQISDNG